MYSLDECTRLWDEAGNHGTPAERIKRAIAWLPYYALLAQPMIEAPFSPESEKDGFPDLLLQEGLVQPDDTVLDIGAGMGSDSLTFASRCKSVTALELSFDCLDVLCHRAKCLDLANIKTVQQPWEEFDTQERFDVCYSSMCPAICNVDELKRMEGFSKRLCCLVTVTRGSYDRHRKAMMAELGIQPKGGMVTEAIHYYNALYLMGRQPEVRCRTVHREYTVPKERILAQYPVYFKIFGVEEERSVPFLAEYLTRNAADGFLHEESHINFAMLTWNVS
jgi:hypothetical protein